MLSGRYVFARVFQRHPFIRRFVIRRDGWKCKICGEPIGLRSKLWHVHHVDYEHECIRPALIKVLAELVAKPKGFASMAERLSWEREHGKASVPSKVIEVPDCRTCRRHCRPAFEACVSRVVAAHARCNWEVG